MEPDPACTHHWIITTERGATSPATCKRCGATRRFPNGEQEYGFQEIGQHDTEIRLLKERIYGRRYGRVGR